MKAHINISARCECGWPLNEMADFTQEPPRYWLECTNLGCAHKGKQFKQPEIELEEIETKPV